MPDHSSRITAFTTHSTLTDDAELTIDPIEPREFSSANVAFLVIVLCRHPTWVEYVNGVRHGSSISGLNLFQPANTFNL